MNLPTVFAAGLLAAVLTVTALRNPLYGLGAFYVVAYLVISWRWPEVALMLIFASAPFQSDLSGGGDAKFSVTEINVLLLLPCFYLRVLLKRSLIRMGPVKWPITFYFLVAIYSCWQHWLGKYTLTSIIQSFIYLVIVVLLFSSTLQNIKKNLLALYASVFIGVFLSAYQMLSLSFLNLNKNGIGGSLSCILIIVIELWLASKDRAKRRWLLLAIAAIVPGLLLTLSRGSWIAAVCGTVILCALRREFKLLFRLAVVLIPLVAISWSLLPQQNREYATGFGKERVNIKLRYASFDIALKHFEDSPIYGSGVGLRKTYDATNLVMLTLAETGVLGLIALFLIHATLFRMIWKTQKRIGRDEEIFSLLAVGAALVAGRLAHGMVDHYWSRGSVSMAWAAAGMAIGVYFLAERRQAAPFTPLMSLAPYSEAAA